MTELTPEALAILAGGDAGSKKGGKLQTILVVVGLTLVAAGGGTALGFLLGKPQPAPVAAAPEPAPVADAPLAAKPDPAAPADVVLALQPVLTDIASPPGTQLRMEASVILAPDGIADQNVLASQIQADMIVFVRTLELAQIEGARGLLHLKEDLLERARLRSPAVIDIMVRSLVVK